MARVSTANHALSKATDGSVDLYDFTLDHTNLLDRVDAALTGVGAVAGGAGFVNGNAGNAGKLLSAQGSSARGRVMGVSAGDDAHLVFQDNAGGAGADKYSSGYDDSADKYAVTYVGGGAALGANGFTVDGSGKWTALNDAAVTGVFSDQTGTRKAVGLFNGISGWTTIETLPAPAQYGPGAAQIYVIGSRYGDSPYVGNALVLISSGSGYHYLNVVSNSSTNLTFRISGNDFQMDDATAASGGTHAYVWRLA